MIKWHEENCEKSPWGQCLTRQVPNGIRRSDFWLVPEKHKFSGTNQKSERRRPLVRHCPQGLFSPFFSFLRAIFFRPFRLSLARTICPWVSEDAGYHATQAKERRTTAGGLDEKIDVCKISHPAPGFQCGFLPTGLVSQDRICRKPSASSSFGDYTQLGLAFVLVRWRYQLRCCCPKSHLAKGQSGVRPLGILGQYWAAED